ncbi:glycosyltransferase [Kordiimonas lipolytica]|uniref:Glycosyltransferase n=2 Tax=Kordiimonas lipolytica TaxID=1662421 RepID=A0ABV8UFT7_9PROT
MAPVPWFPFGHSVFGRYGEYAKVPAREVRHGIIVHHPRFLVVPKVGMRLNPWFLARAAARKLRALQQSGFDPDLIDAHYLYPDGVAAAMLGRAFDKPVVMTARGSDVTEIGRLPVFRGKILQAAESSSHIITVSNSLRQELAEMGVRTPITTLRNGVDADRFHILPDVSAKPHGIDDFHLVFAGWLIPRKRPDLVLKAAGQIPGARVTMVGEGPELPSLKVLAQSLGISSRVTFLGQQPPEAMPGLLGRADVLMLPSEREGWANVLLEAMACGTPVVSNAVAGALDLVTVPEAGRLVYSQTPEAYATAIKDVIYNHAGRRSVRAYAQQFGWREVSLAQQAIFEKAVEEFKKGQAVG